MTSATLWNGVAEDPMPAQVPPVESKTAGPTDAAVVELFAYISDEDNQRKLLQCLLKRFKNRELAEEVLQTCMLRLCQNPPTGATLDGYEVEVFVRLKVFCAGVDTYRRMKLERKRGPCGLREDDLINDYGPQSQAERSELLGIVRQLLFLLPSKNREVIQDWLDGCTVRQTAAKHGIGADRRNAGVGWLRRISGRMREDESGQSKSFNVIPCWSRLNGRPSASTASRSSMPMVW